MTALLIIALATWQAVEIWHHSSLFADWRSRLDNYDDFLVRLLKCPWCLSVWVAGSFWLLWEVPFVGRVLLGALAASRLANLGNDAFFYVTRTPRPGFVPESDHESHEAGAQ